MSGFNRKDGPFQVLISAEALATYQAGKRAHKAALRAGGDRTARQRPVAGHETEAELRQVPLLVLARPARREVVVKELHSSESTVPLCSASRS